MSNDYLLYENMDMMDQNLPIIFHDYHLSKGDTDICFPCHWHEKIELLYFTQGEALIRCNSLEIAVKKGDLIVVNSNELHQGYFVSKSTAYFCIIFDTSLFQSRYVDTCETKYINPISNNCILFKNKIENEKQVTKLIREFVNEYEKKETGYELAVKATLLQILVILLRNHVQLVLTAKEYDSRMRNLKRFNSVLEYIESNYYEKITIDQLCSMVNISRFHFCRVFKSITGKTLGEYLNLLRISKAEAILGKGDANITEAAMACGFDDMNYFSRIYKKYKHESPSSALRKRNQKPD
jgi:AraC-like DNA-binding protein